MLVIETFFSQTGYPVVQLFGGCVAKQMKVELQAFSILKLDFAPTGGGGVVSGILFSLFTTPPPTES